MDKTKISQMEVLMSFDPLLADLRNVSPDRAIAVLQATYRGISSMSSREVVATYQSVTTYMEESGNYDSMIYRVLNALRVQMIHLSQDILYGDSRQRRFEAVVGHSLQIPIVPTTSVDQLEYVRVVPQMIRVTPNHGRSVKVVTERQLVRQPRQVAPQQARSLWEAIWEEIRNWFKRG